MEPLVEKNTSESIKAAAIRGRLGLGGVRRVGPQRGFVCDRSWRFSLDGLRHGERWAPAWRSKPESFSCERSDGEKQHGG
jgi:hypothetical protein